MPPRLRPALDALGELLAPLRCPRCGVRSAPPWCDACDGTARRTPLPGSCDRCGLPGAAPGDGHPCWPHDGPVRRSLHPYAYAGVVADAIVRGKTAGAWAVWPALGERLGAHLAVAGVRVSVVVPLPTEPRRRRRRGVDHTALLAAAVGRRLSLPVRGLLAAAPGAPDQGRRPAAERRDVPAAVFRPLRRLACVPVLLVDDVVTTGGTATAAATILRAAGAAEVTLAVVARAGRHPLGAATSARP